MKSNLNVSEDPCLLLDSRLITATDTQIKLIKLSEDKPKIYDYKVVQCGSYIQVYHYLIDRIKSPKKYDDDDLNLVSNFDISDSKEEVENSDNKENDDNQDNTENSVSKKKTKIIVSNKIELKNIIRSKLQCQRIAKANMEQWKTFITLTFKENVEDIDYANNKFRNFVTLLKRHYKDFMYLCVPEYQKRGAVHYHMFSNIDINDDTLMYTQEDNPKYRHIKYWRLGFSNVQAIVNDPVKVVGYISKYMTKDIDNRLFSRRRFLYSQNCLVPEYSYIDSQDSKDLEFLQKKIQDKKLIYQNKYLNSYDDSEVTFLEFL